MSHHPGSSGTAIGTIGGTLLSVAANIHAEDLVKTTLLAIIGATTSFTSSYLLKQGYLWARSRLKK